MASDLPLFEAAARYPQAPGHVGTDTSRDAAEAITPRAASLRAQVLTFICDCGERGATDEEIQIGLQMGGNTARPRRRELQLFGKIVDSGERRPTASGRNAIVWRVKP